MIIEKVILENFGSFRGSTELDLSPKKDRNIILIVGHGGAGKTTVGKAIRWALYNRPFQESDRPFHETGAGESDPQYTKDEVLKLFFREGGGAQTGRPPTESSMSVQLLIWPGESVKAAMEAHGLRFGTYRLERSASVSKIIPKSRDLILPPLSMKGPEQRSVTGNPEGIIDEFFLPASTSTFFMFHGDRIRDLTKQIDQPVTSAIRQILDVTAMKNAEVDLDKVMSSLSRSISSNSKDEDIRQKKQRAVDSLKEQEQKTEDLFKEKKQIFEDAKLELDKLTKEQSDLLEVGGLIDKYKDKTKDRDVLTQQLENVEESIRSALDDFPREVLYHLLRPHADEYGEIEKRNETHRKKAEQLRGKRQQIDELRPGQKCPVCKQPFPDHMVSARQREIAEIDEKIDSEEKAVQPLRPEYIDLMRSVTSLESSRYDPQELLVRRFDLRGQLTDVENAISDIKKELGSHNDASIRKKAAKIQEDVRTKSYDLGVIKTSLDQLEKALGQYKDGRRRMEREIAELGGGTAKILKKNYDLASSLEKVFGECVTQLADEKRKEIAAEAGKMLLSITIKPALFDVNKAVEVDQEFRIRPINYNGDPLELSGEASSERSLLSLSFIYGLLKASEREAPVILDTFFGNLDPNQIRRITAQMPKFSSQVILMTTLTEFEDLRTKGDPEFWKKVARFIFLYDSPKTDFVTKQSVFDNLEDAEIEARAQEKEFSKEVVIR